MSEQRITKLVKVPLGRPIRDKPPSFPPLNDLELNLVENKKLLKDGLPLIPIKEIDATKIKRDDPEEDEEIDIDIGKPHKSKKKRDKEKHSSKSGKSGKSGKKEKSKHSHSKEEKKKRHSKHPKGGHKRHASLEEALGGDEEQDEPLDESEGDEEEDEDATEQSEEEDDSEEEEEEEQLTPEEIEERDKEEFIWRFRILKKKYPNAEIPEYNEHSNLSTMKKTYDRTLRSLSLDSSVETYRTYLVGGFMILEFVSTNWFNINMTGFTKQQFIVMNKYDSLLIELGEKSYNNLGSRLPVEVRLIGFILMQAAIFFIAKMIAEKAGEKVADLFSGMTPQAESRQQPEKSKTMRGPSISVDEIRKMTK